MKPRSVRRLTERQRAVMERIDRRVPIKVIAQDLGVSETRINQHIRALKTIYAAVSLGELVENFRAKQVEPEPETRFEDSVAIDEETGVLRSLRQSAHTGNPISPSDDPAEFARPDDPAPLMLGDAQPLIEQAPWHEPVETGAALAVRDGSHAVLFRLGAIVGVASGVLVPPWC